MLDRNTGGLDTRAAGSRQHLAGDRLAGRWQPYMRESCSLVSLQTLCQYVGAWFANQQETRGRLYGRALATQQGHHTFMSGTFDNRCLYQPPLSQLSHPNAAHRQDGQWCMLLSPCHKSQCWHRPAFCALSRALHASARSLVTHSLNKMTDCDCIAQLRLARTMDPCLDAKLSTSP